MTDKAVPASFAEHHQVLEATRAHLADAIAEVGALMSRRLAGGAKVLFCGNGGSAAQAQHMASDFEGRFLRDRRALPALALSANTSSVTAIGNDYGFQRIFARAVEAHGREGDVLMCISTSGNSPNLLEAARVAAGMGLTVVGLTGEGGGKLAPLCHYLLDVPSRSTPRIQEIQLLVGHMLCQLVEDALDPE